MLYIFRIRIIKAKLIQNFWIRKKSYIQIVIGFHTGSINGEVIREICAEIKKKIVTNIKKKMHFLWIRKLSKISDK